MIILRSNVQRKLPVEIIQVAAPFLICRSSHGFPGVGHQSVLDEGDVLGRASVDGLEVALDEGQLL